MAVDVYPAVPQNRDTPLGDRVSATQVQPPLIIGMRLHSVQFDAERVALVKIVEVPAASVDRGPHLADRGGQSVRALDPPDVTVLKHRVNAVAYLGESQIQLGPPASSWALLHRFGQFRGGGQPALAGSADQAERGVDRRREVGQIKYGLLDASPRRLKGGVDSAGDATRTVDHHAGHGEHPSAGIDRHVNGRASFIGEFGQFGRGLMTERDTGANAVYDGPQGGLPGEPARVHQVDTPPDDLPSPSLPQVVNSVPRHAAVQRLFA